MEGYIAYAIILCYLFVNAPEEMIMSE